jgi:hypothetical protein
VFSKFTVNCLFQNIRMCYRTRLYVARHAWRWDSLPKVLIKHEKSVLLFLTVINNRICLSRVIIACMTPHPFPSGHALNYHFIIICSMFSIHLNAVFKEKYHMKRIYFISVYSKTASEFLCLLTFRTLSLFQLPLTFNPMAQVSRDGSWHIPYEMEFVSTPPQSFEAPSTWLCLRSDKPSPSLSQVRHKKISRMS